MSQAPVMPVFTDALIGDTTHLNTEEFGAYCLLLFATWRNNGVPFAENDDRRLARICRASERRWITKIKPALIEFFDFSDSTWLQKRLQKEWENVKQKRAIQREKGKLSANSKALKTNDTPSTAVDPGLPPGSNRRSTESQPSISISTSSLRSEEDTESPPITAPPKNRRRSTADPAFDEFWLTYPRREDKGHAIKAWAKALQIADSRTIIDGAQKYAARRKGEDTKFTAHPATWLNGQRWADDEAPPSGNDFASETERQYREWGVR